MGVIRNENDTNMVRNLILKFEKKKIPSVYVYSDKFVITTKIFEKDGPNPGLRENTVTKILSIFHKY